ncbi:MAG TPA: hypothetical protein VIX19_11285 [Terriglobales bacterium]
MSHQRPGELRDDLRWDGRKMDNVADGACGRRTRIVVMEYPG